MDWLNSVFQFIVDVLLQEMLGVLIGIFLFDKIRDAIVKKKYGGWQVIIRRDGEDQVTRSITAKKAKAILEEPADKVVFLKGVASPFGKIHGDLLIQGIKSGLFVEDKEKKLFIVDYDKQKEDIKDKTDIY